MKSILKHIEESKVKSDEIVKNNIRAGQYRQFFKNKSKELSEGLVEMREDLDSIAPEPPSRLPLTAMIFWDNHFHNEKSIAWDYFVSHYTSENAITSMEMERKFKKFLCNIDDEYISIYTFYSTCSQFGYPIMLFIDNHVDTMKLAELIMSLTKELYSPEFGLHWGKLLELKDKAKINGKSNDKEIWLSILHQYRSKASQEMLDNVDIPGKARIYTFIEVCETIDEVNYNEILHLNANKSWDKGRPQVYSF
ncbi:hypothetical protein INT43_004459 [Umbelopsis isabellina]|uniref:Adaptor protein Cbl EF hand-like domain-containing protein n=1 Tax=Mortierella isabellina TaxID=91625 RepID=A0A8H7PD93_MORIS|nr:hypothetical protein INT43_004459 [Umbelopsis isabellina]